MKRLLAAPLVTALLGAAALAPGARATTPPTATLTARHLGQPLRLRTVADSSDSVNWSGYSIAPPAGHAVTGVASTFTVPSVKISTGYGAIWAGIGGSTSTDLIQAGVGIDPVSGDFAWYELLPDGEQQLGGCAGDANCTVSPGDHISVNIHQANQAATEWAIVVKDLHRWTWASTVPYASTRSSAEWILEAPTVGIQSILPFVTTTTFAGNHYALDGGPLTRLIAPGHPTQITMNDVGVVAEAIPSDLGRDGDSFAACAYSSSCPRP